MEHLPTQWDRLVDWWYHPQSPEVMELLVEGQVMNRLHFGVAKKTGKLLGKHPGMVTPEDVSKISPKDFRKISGFDSLTMAFLADVLRFSKRTTPGGWSKKTKPPALLERCA